MPEFWMDVIADRLEIEKEGYTLRSEPIIGFVVFEATCSDKENKFLNVEPLIQTDSSLYGIPETYLYPIGERALGVIPNTTNLVFLSGYDKNGYQHRIGIIQKPTSTEVQKLWLQFKEECERVEVKS
jgi:hypothetical protein